ncbi:MAG: manganese efflux pump MntP family protein [Alphaproteobacteria bacterium]|nr:manganese efflux pump MntP family protein [Alphaproteobacteria bacterium]
MSALSTTLLAFSMSADAFAVALGKGAAIRKPRLRDALRTGIIFGSVEALTPLIGWLAGVAASRYIAAFDHWVAFFILGGVGGKLLYESFLGDAETEKPARHGTGLLMLTAVGTSIDALAVGVTLAFLPVNIWLTAASIGAATTLMVTVGIVLGHRIGSRFGRMAEALGGLTLIAIGSHILLTHLGIF